MSDKMIEASAESADFYFSERGLMLDTIDRRSVYSAAFSAGVNWKAAQAPEATEEMIVAGLKVADPMGELVDWDSSQNECTDRETIKAIYDAMRAAAPSIVEKRETKS